ncbi:MAG: hypothetical protein HZA78_09550 [Candidatus Schekmanbacteria bacterium]|nr:hypothetical protein [Candidatus Schekmanbacteria bacterium]
MSTIVTINSGLGSSLGVFQNGKPVFCMEEERLIRTKNWMGFPYKALDYIIKNGIVRPSEVEYVGIANAIYRELNRTTFYNNYERHYRRACGNPINITRVRNELRKNIKSSDFLFGVYLRSRQQINRGKEKDLDYLAHLGFRPDRIERVEHHLCHASAAYYGLARHLDEKYLVFTLDGGGDRYTSALYLGQGGNLQLLSSSPCYSIGNMYSAVTHHLGFTPHEHEYKLMGLAPYVDKKHQDKYKKYFSQFLKLADDDTRFENSKLLYHEIFMRHLLNDLKRARFDNVAAGLQAFTEEILGAWIRGAIKKYGVGKILCSGGVFMNVKTNMLLSQMPEVEYIDVFPSCGDESNVFGAGFYLYNTHIEKKVDNLKSYCLGSVIGGDLPAVLEKYRGQIEYERIKDINAYIVGQLVAGKIVARCSGPMEFGARALGNRSILANPSNLNVVGKINRAIKNRDFWMPFAPAMLWDKAGQLIRIPNALKSQGSPYMMFAFETVEDQRESIACALHQSDFTARAETVTKERYPDFYQIVEGFYQKTGIPCVLNTSFNLHGHPIVENSDQAVDVLLKSKLDLLVINDYAIWRKG